MIVAARTFERVFFVTRNHHGFVRHHLDQVHLSAARKTPHVGCPFTFNSARYADEMLAEYPDRSSRRMDLGQQPKYCIKNQEACGAKETKREARHRRVIL
jgi:hypothetical protein